MGLTLIRAVRRMGLEGCEMKDDFVMVEIVVWMFIAMDEDEDGVI